MLLSNDKATSGTVKYVLFWYGLIVTWSSGDVGMVGLVTVCDGNCLGWGGCGVKPDLTLFTCTEKE